MKQFIKITSKENEIIKRISALQKSSKRRREEGVFVLEGLRLCEDAVLNGIMPEVLVVSETALKKYEEQLSAFNASTEYLVPDSLFAKITDTVNPQGILCLSNIPKSELILDNNGKYIALENTQDPSNLGAISRTAEALGISGIILCGGCDPYSSKSLRASMGALLRIPVYQTDDMFSLFSKFELKSYAAILDPSADKLGDFVFPSGSVALIGNEANGLTTETIDNCDVKMTIPMSGNAESLNAAVAASIIMWEMCKC